MSEAEKSPFGYVVTTNVPESSPYRHLFYKPDEINTAYLDNVLYSTPVFASPQSLKPLTDEQVWQAVSPAFEHSEVRLRDVLPLARAIERAHGIAD
jgi:hypothetical protein